MSHPFLTHDLLRGTHVVLRKPTPQDVVSFTEWGSDMEYARLLRRGWVIPPSMDAMQSWYGQMDKSDNEIPFSIFTRDDDRLIGMMVINNIFWQARHCSFFIGIGDPADRGRGYGVDSLRVLLRYCFQEMNMQAVRLEVIGYNDQARHAYERVGFKHDGVLRSFVFRDGVYYDIDCMSILRDEWTDVLP